MLAGIDVGKFNLDVSIGGDGVVGFSNTAEGIDALMMALREAGVTRIVCEPTGGYEREMVRALRGARLRVQMAHPNKVRSFAQACGILAKTDCIDAQVLYRYGEVFVDQTSMPLDDKILKLRDILRRRQQLIAIRVKEMNRLEKHPGAVTRASCERHLDWLEMEIAELDQALKTQLDESELNHQVGLYSSVKGVGLITAATLIAELPELGRFDGKSLTALAGLAPWARDSGKQHGYRAIRGGRASVRKALYMAAISAIRTTGAMRSFYQRLRHRGKAGKIALVAVMRKMLMLLNAIAHRGTPWVENPANA